MAIRNRKGQTLSADGTVTKASAVAPAPKKRGRPKKTEESKPKVHAPLPSGAFHEAFPFHLEYKEDKATKHCYFQCEVHMDKHIERYKLDRRTIKISATEPRTN